MGVIEFREGAKESFADFWHKDTKKQYGSVSRYDGYGWFSAAIQHAAAHTWRDWAR